MTSSILPAQAAGAPASRWSGRPLQAIALRTIVYAAPLVGSIVFVHYASKVVPAPAGSLVLFLVWWLALSTLATGVLVVVDRSCRRLLPLAALLKLSLVFPDEAPSRFQIAMRSGSVDDLAGRISAAKDAAATATPSEAAGRLLELVAALNIHDRLTRGHCERVRAYSVMIGQELGLSSDELDLLNWAALLHDVGKLQVPGEILTKDGRPTDEEWDVLRQHPELGDELVAPIREWLGRWTDAVGYHHERWDGGGYPHGLEGEEIPLAGRIVAVADSFDVITSARSYKTASAAENGRMEIARCAGTQFDPRVVRAFLAVSLGRMRFVMGPLSWLAHAPLLARLPLTPGFGTLAGALSVAATATVGGMLSPPTAPAVATAPIVAHHPSAHSGQSSIVLRTPARHRQTPKPHVKLPPVGPTAAINDPVSPSTPIAPTVTPPTSAEGGAAPVTTVAVEPPPGNHAPTFTNGGGVTVLEDSAPTTRPWAGAIDSRDPGQSIRFVTSSTNGGLFTARPAIDPVGALRFTPAPDAYGVAQVSVTAIDDGGTADGGTDRSTTQTFALTVLPVDDPPSFVAGSDVAVDEGAGPQSQAWASAISAGPPDEAGQRVTFAAAADNPGLFTIGGQPSLAPDGTLSFEPAPFATGTAHVTATAGDDGGTANGGVDTSAAAAFTITIAPVNQAPTFVGAGNQTVLEDSGAHTVQWATAIDAGAPGESGQTVTLGTSNDNPSLFSTQPSVDQTGVLTYAPAADANGTVHVTVTAHDDGGTANGGHDTSSRTFTITITPVNDAPTFTTTGNVSVLENAGPQSLAWVSSHSTGPGNETAQQIVYAVSNDNPSLFAGGAQPALAADGTLTFTPATNAAGSAQITVTATDDGGTANGGHDSLTATYTLTVGAVNQAPTFTSAGNDSVLEDSGARSIQWATAIDPGAPNESSQTVSFGTTNDNNGLFASQPSISSSGLLTYEPAANANGTATITVTAQDNGGTANGGQDTTTVTFSITVVAVNDAPTLSPAADQSIDEDDGTQAVALTTASPGPSDEAGQIVTLTTSTDHPEYFDIAGQPTIAADGTLTYTPAQGAYGTANVTVTAQDSGGTANGGLDTSSIAFQIVIAPLPPNAADDAYSTTVLTPLHVAAPGVLANDADVNSSTLDVTPGTIATAHGSVTINADGSFDYQPSLLFLLGGTDSFTYTITNGAGQTATGTVTISVDLLAPSTNTLYLATSGYSAEVWDLTASPPAVVSPVPDLDADGNPGLTIKGGDGKETITDPRRQQTWTYETGFAGLSLDGPLTLHLTAASHNFDTNKAETIWIYAYDCPGGLASAAITTCTNIGSNKVLVQRWNPTGTWTEHDVGVFVSHDLAANRQLRIRLLNGGAELWLPLVSPYETGLDYTN